MKLFSILDETVLDEILLANWIKVFLTLETWHPVVCQARDN